MSLNIAERELLLDRFWQVWRPWRAWRAHRTLLAMEDEFQAIRRAAAAGG